MQGSGPHLEAVCEQCDAFEPYEPTEWFQHIWFLYQLQCGGYPFAQDDLTCEEWMDLGILKKELMSPLGASGMGV